MLRNVRPSHVADIIAGRLSMDQILAVNGIDVKVGHTNDLSRRRPQYRQCEEKEYIKWWRVYPADRRMLAGEYLVPSFSFAHLIQSQSGWLTNC